VKLLFFLVAALVVIWAWRSRAPRVGDEAARPEPVRETQPLHMVCCRMCGVHIPDNEVVTGRFGCYCSSDHRQQSESS